MNSVPVPEGESFRLVEQEYVLLLQSLAANTRGRLVPERKTTQDNTRLLTEYNTYLLKDSFSEVIVEFRKMTPERLTELAAEKSVSSCAVGSAMNMSMVASIQGMTMSGVVSHLLGNLNQIVSRVFNGGKKSAKVHYVTQTRQSPYHALWYENPNDGSVCVVRIRG